MSTRRAKAYIRRSSGKDAPASWQTQRDAVLRAAGDRGDQLFAVETLGEAQTHPDWYVDWGRSGADPSRVAFVRMLAAIEAGEVSTVYAYHSDRLARRTATLAALLDTAEESGVSIVDGSGHDLVDDGFRLAAEVTGSVSAGEHRSALRRNRARTARQRIRGDSFGQPPYGWRRASRQSSDERITFERIPGHPLEAVLETVQRNGGNILRSARELNARGIAAPRGGLWGTGTLQGLVKREAPTVRPFGERRGRPPRRPRYLLRLLRCHCGTLLSPSGAHKADHWSCRNGQRDASHPRPYNVQESIILPWIMAEAARYRAPEYVDLGRRDTEAARATLESQRERLRTQHRLGVITDDELAAGWAEIRAELDRLAALAAVDLVELPSIDWHTDPHDAVNRVLRALWHHVELGPDLRPVRAEWRVPDWRVG